MNNRDNFLISFKAIKNQQLANFSIIPVPSENAIRHHHFELLNHQLTNIITKKTFKHTHTLMYT